MEEAQTYTGNPLHDMDDEELVSKMTLARDDGNNADFRTYRQELMYRLRRSHIEYWLPPPRFPKPQAAVNDLVSLKPMTSTDVANPPKARKSK